MNGGTLNCHGRTAEHLTVTDEWQNTELLWTNGGTLNSHAVHKHKTRPPAITTVVKTCIKRNTAVATTDVRDSSVDIVTI
jgi:hypothetical protein